MAFAFWSNIFIGPGNDTFQTDDDDDGAGLVTHTLTNGETTWDALREDLIADITTDFPIQIGISSSGHVTINRTSGFPFRIVWTDAPLRDLLGFTENTLTGASSYIAPRRMRAAFYSTMPSAAQEPTIEEHDPMPGLIQVVQTDALSGVRRTTRSGVRRKRATFLLRNIPNDARYTSPSGAAVKTYANALSTEEGLTPYTHLRDFFYDSTTAGSQGYSDGRVVYYFADAADASVATSATDWSPALGGDYTRWIVDREDCESFSARKARPPKSHLYHVDLRVAEYLAP